MCVYWVLIIQGVQHHIPLPPPVHMYPPPPLPTYPPLLLSSVPPLPPPPQAAPLKLLEKGVSKEALAGLVLLEFPCELISAFLAGRWATTGTPSGPWLLGYRLRLLTAVGVTALVARFPLGASSLQQHPGYFAVLAVLGLVTSFTSTLMFTALGSLYTKISDPSMGGAYLTLLNTISNMGVILPKLLVWWGGGGGGYTWGVGWFCAFPLGQSVL